MEKIYRIISNEELYALLKKSEYFDKVLMYQSFNLSPAIMEQIEDDAITRLKEFKETSESN